LHRADVEAGLEQMAGDAVVEGIASQQLWGHDLLKELPALCLYVSCWAIGGR
jgi:hypothetical protein